MKTNEADSPWDPKEGDQKVDGSAKLYKDGIDQLDRDTLRFLELNPDIEMANIKIATNGRARGVPTATTEMRLTTGVRESKDSR